MAFVPPAFQGALAGIENSHPPTATDFANAWADAFFQGFGSPTPPSTTGSAAKAAAFGIFLGAFEDYDPAQNPSGLNVMKAAVTAFAATLALGMLPNFAAIPPASPYPGWEAFASQISDSSNKGTMPGLITAASIPWFMTGIAVHTITGVTLPWS